MKWGGGISFAREMFVESSMVQFQVHERLSLAATLTKFLLEKRWPKRIPKTQC